MANRDKGVYSVRMRKDLTDGMDRISTETGITKIAIVETVLSFLTNLYNIEPTLFLKVFYKFRNGNLKELLSKPLLTEEEIERYFKKG